jgi:hypothetical protein
MNVMMELPKVLQPHLVKAPKIVYWLMLTIEG